MASLRSNFGNFLKSSEGYWVYAGLFSKGLNSDDMGMSPLISILAVSEKHFETASNIFQSVVLVLLKDGKDIVFGSETINNGLGVPGIQSPPAVH